jgi:hypothetical protein
MLDVWRGEAYGLAPFCFASVLRAGSRFLALLGMEERTARATANAETEATTTTTANGGSSLGSKWKDDALVAEGGEAEDGDGK